MRTILISSLFKFSQVFTKGSFTLFADKGHFRRFAKRMIGSLFGVTFWALKRIGRGYRRESGEVGSDGLWSCLSSGRSDTYIEESLAAWSSDGHLSVEDMFAVRNEVSMSVCCRLVASALCCSPHRLDLNRKCWFRRSRRRAESHRVDTAL